MSIMVIPIRMPSVRAHIRADPRLTFEVATAFGARQQDGSGSRVLERAEDGRLLVEFWSDVPVRGGRRRYRTVEWVTLRPPARVEFRGIEGPLHVLQDRFVLDDGDGCTTFRYESCFALRWSVVGWLIGMVYVRPRLRRFMREHVEALKAAAEARVARSRVYSRPRCGHSAA